MNLSTVKSYLLTGAASIAVAPMIGMAGASIAEAADMPLKAAPPVAAPPVAAPSWAGWYIGVSAGGASEHSDFDDPSHGQTASKTGGAFIGGAQIGYNWQRGNFVYGLEGDISGLTKATGAYFNSANSGVGPYGSHVSWLATIRGRLGVTVGDGNTLLYGTGGAAFGHVKAVASELPNWSAVNDYSATRVGWAAGAGIERMLTPHWTVGVEGLFADLGSYSKASSDAGKCCTTIRDRVFIGRAKLNYKF